MSHATAPTSKWLVGSIVVVDYDNDDVGSVIGNVVGNVVGHVDVGRGKKMNKQSSKYGTNIYILSLSLSRICICFFLNSPSSNNISGPLNMA